MEKKLLAPHVDRFTDEMRVRNWSTGTSEQYVKALADFERFIVERYPRVGSVAGITDEIVRAYQLWLCQRENKRRGRTLAPATQRMFLSAVRSFFAFCVTERIVLIDPARNVELPRVGRRLPRGVLSPKEMRAVLRAPNLATYTGLRDRAILETFYSTGIRHMELLRLRVCDGSVFPPGGRDGGRRPAAAPRRASTWSAATSPSCRTSSRRIASCRSVRSPLTSSVNI